MSIPYNRQCHVDRSVKLNTHLAAIVLPCDSRATIKYEVYCIEVIFLTWVLCSISLAVGEGWVVGMTFKAHRPSDHDRVSVSITELTNETLHRASPCLNHWTYVELVLLLLPQTHESMRRPYLSGSYSEHSDMRQYRSGSSDTNSDRSLTEMADHDHWLSYSQYPTCIMHVVVTDEHVSFTYGMYLYMDWCGPFPNSHLGCCRNAFSRIRICRTW